MTFGNHVTAHIVGWRNSMKMRFQSKKTDPSVLLCVRKAVLGIPLITNAGLCSTWLTSRCQSRHQRQWDTQSWLCIFPQRRTQSVNPTLWIDWWEASFGNVGSFWDFFLFLSLWAVECFLYILDRWCSWVDSGAPRPSWEFQFPQDQ